jgi:adenosine deaminase
MATMTNQGPTNLYQALDSEAWRMMPKVELHSHLDCTLSYDVVRRLAPGTTEEAYWRTYVAPAHCNSLANYLEHTRNGVALLQSRRALQLVVSDLFEQMARENVIYAEIRFAPLLHTAGSLDEETVVETVASACDDAVEKSGIEAGLILCTLRHYTRAQSQRTVELVHACAGTRVMALDIAGDEAGYPLDEHAAAFRFAGRHGIPVTAHAGEAAGPESVWQTLDLCQPTRIGHGIHSVRDPKLMAELRRRNIHLEICPICNVQTGAVGSLEEHPIDRLFQYGLSVGINTDTRGITNTTLTKEYAQLAAHFDWTAEHFRACNYHALEASFLPAEKKARLKAVLDDYVLTRGEAT